MLTDRAFLAEPKTMVKAFTLGGIVAGWFETDFAALPINFVDNETDNETELLGYKETRLSNTFTQHVNHD